ncbi:MAG TPA: MarR family winged helix-turn-helix transcriptional regulator [Alphaproteobacteria bacterium]|nr:MarR family winged helix-turn-helix transcriptional regulator [Alphaproteobacteria bacterium]
MSKSDHALPPTVSQGALLSGGSDARFRQMVYDLFTVSVRMETVRDALAKDLGVSGPQYSILMAIARLAGTGGVPVGQVADQLHVTGAFVTVETGKLVRAKLVEKSPNPKDGRSVLLRLSERGAKRLERLAPKVCAVNDRFFGVLDRADFETLARIASALVQRSDGAVAIARTGQLGPDAAIPRSAAIGPDPA